MSKKSKKPSKKSGHKKKATAPRKTIATKPVRAAGSAKDEEQWSKHREYMSDYQRRMYALGRRGRLATLLKKIQERIEGYIEKSKKWEITDDEVGILQEVVEWLDAACQRLEGEADDG